MTRLFSTLKYSLLDNQIPGWPGIFIGLMDTPVFLHYPTCSAR